MTDKTTAPPPAYFLSLSLENVRSFGEKQTISFARPDGRPAQWTIILGDNGVGKTTVLKALAALVPGKEVDYDYHELKGPEYYPPVYASGWKNKWRALRHDGKYTSTMAYEAYKGDLLSTTNLNLSKENRIHVQVEHTQISFARERYSSTTVDETSLGLIAYGYGAGRTVGNSTIGEVPASDDTCISLFDDRADLLNPEEWFLNIDYGSKLAGENADQLNKARTLVEKMLKTVLLGVTELRIASTGTPQKPQISLQFLLFDTWVRLRDMSLGYQTLVVWLTDFASKLFIRYPDSPNPLEEPAIVLIDEIDLHLHPSWQRKLIGFLSGIFKNTQFIATAHSPLVVQAAGDAGANVILLRREGDQTVVVTDVEDVRGWRVDQILNSELFEDTSTLSVQTEEELQRRNALLLRKKLTVKEKAELERLNAKVAAQPIGDTPPERKVESLLARLARNLKEEDMLD
ncbi:AAA family ATPase [Siccationidurans soli]|uniref:AAA family ATPase n=2 Tax=Hymenobacter negativus TaxID=2795026 RepID=A0ABS3Q9X8_9BACT|nr:AAA family ATPase [Hymenobacter negativus]